MHAARSKTLLDDLNVCTDENYLLLEEIEMLKSDGWRVHKLINGYIRFLRSRTTEGSSRVQETLPDDTKPSEDQMSDLFFDPFNPSSLQPFNE